METRLNDDRYKRKREQRATDQDDDISESSFGRKAKLIEIENE